ncbi:MAG TPA: helix-turn-helix domain-containing protein [Opitutaceae bacterium]|nr:helix-turn-helix domain-containing protein [Opitutaceae bacterium]
MEPSPIIRREFALPPPELREFIERLWSWESDTAVPLPLLLPGTGAELVLHHRTPFVALGSDGSRHFPAAAHLSGLRGFSCRLVAPGPVGFVAVRFRSGAVRHFGRLHAPELIDRFPAAAEHFGPVVDNLAAELRRLPDFAARAARIGGFLLERLRRSGAGPARADRVLEALYYREPEASVGELAEDFGYSTRQLERLVAEAAGLSLKRFRRVARLHHTMRYLLLTGETDYLDAALARGFYDQAHFIHELGALTGRTPREVLTPEAFVSHFYNPRLPR